MLSAVRISGERALSMQSAARISGDRAISMPSMISGFRQSEVPTTSIVRVLGKAQSLCCLWFWDSGDRALSMLSMILGFRQSTLFMPSMIPRFRQSRRLQFGFQAKRHLYAVYDFGF
jgi:hypothetical protein